MVHLQPLPGSPRWGGSLEAVVERAVVADQGLIQGDAYRTLRYRRLLGTSTRLFVDVGGKHAVPLAPAEPSQVARDAAYRGLADALVVSGAATGEPTPLDDVTRVR